MQTGLAGGDDVHIAWSTVPIEKWIPGPRRRIFLSDSYDYSLRMHGK